MRFDIITMLPEGFDYLSKSVLGRAQKKKKIKIKIWNLRDFTTDKHKTVDDRPYGGGVGLVMKVDVAYRALSSVLHSKPSIPKSRTRILLMTPQGKVFTQADAKRIAKRYERLVILAGRFEGYDERIRKLVDEEISIGDYILTGGELPAMVIVDAISRLIPGVLGKEESALHESFSASLLEYPQYTRPPVFKFDKKILAVPAILRSGNHKAIENWRREQAEKRTRKRRPDLWAKRLGQ